MRAPAFLSIVISVVASFAAGAGVSATAAQARDLPITANAVLGGFRAGSAQLVATGEDDTAAATISAPALQLGPDARYRITACLKLHVQGRPPVARCSEAVADTRGQTGITSHDGPVVTLADAVGPDTPAWAAARVDIDAQADDGTWSRTASTLPDSAGTPDAIAADRAAGGMPYPAQGTAVPGIVAGGVNTGGPDSFCVPQDDRAASDPPAGVTVDARGDAPAYSETGLPSTGDPSSPRGVVLLLHGGGWFGVGARDVEQIRGEADRWRARGWLTVNADYRGCGDGPADALWFARHVQAAHRGLPMCVLGQSAGALLALLAAAAMPGDIDCVVAEGAPVDLPALAGDAAYDPDTGGPSTVGPRWASNLAVAAFGAENLRAFSADPARLRMPLLLASGAADPILAPVQAQRLRDAIRADDPDAPVRALVLDAGDVPWVHAGISSAAMAAFVAQEDALATAAVARHAAATDPGTAISTPTWTPAPAGTVQAARLTLAVTAREIAGKVVIRITPPRAGRLRVTLVTSAATAQALHHATRLATRTVRARAAQMVRVHIALPRSLRRRIARRHHVTTRVVVTESGVSAPFQATTRLRLLGR